MEVRPDIKISDEAFEYLVVQHGRVSDALRLGRANWEEVYRESVWRQYLNMLPHLPAKCKNVVDIGGGLSGISILLNEHYRGCTFTVVDGANDAPTVVKHNKTFSNANVAWSFLHRNGVERAVFLSPDSAKKKTVEPNSLCISLASYCFHYSPEEYLNYVAGAETKIFDVRHRYQNMALSCFGTGLPIYEAAKFKRMLWKR